MPLPGTQRLRRTCSLWCGLVGGIVVFVFRVTATYLHDGRPFDPQLIRDFHASGAPNLAAYAVTGNLSAALGMLAVIPAVASRVASRVSVGAMFSGCSCAGLLAGVFEIERVSRSSLR
jgi:hypothetical protein